MDVNWSEWIDIDTLKILSRHASGVIGAIVFFKVIALFVEWGFKEGDLRTIVETIDSFVLVGLSVWLAYQMAYLLWIRRVRNGPSLCLLVA